MLRRHRKSILKKRNGFRKAYDGFALDRVAAYAEQDRNRLLADKGIVRNRLKVDAAIENARRVLAIREESGSFAAWLFRIARNLVKHLSAEHQEIVGRFLIDFLKPLHPSSQAVLRQQVIGVEKNHIFG